MITQSSLNASNLPSWDTWRTHRIDWLAARSFWYLDGVEAANNTYSVPRKPSGLVMNMWSDGGEWSGNMSVGDSAEYHIQWIELVFNTSGPVEGPGGGGGYRKREEEAAAMEKRKSKGCQIVCRVDGVKDAGFPEVALVSAAGLGVVPLLSSWRLVVVVGLMAIVMEL